MSWVCFTGSQQGECWLPFASSARHRLPIKQEMEVKDAKAGKTQHTMFCVKFLSSTSVRAEMDALHEFHHLLWPLSPVWLLHPELHLGSQEGVWQLMRPQNKVKSGYFLKIFSKTFKMMDRRIMLEQVFNVSSLIFVWYESPEVFRCVNRLLSTEHLVKWRSLL